MGAGPRAPTVSLFTFLPFHLFTLHDGNISELGNGQRCMIGRFFCGSCRIMSAIAVP